jgi:penicillin-binding protein 2
MKDPFEISDSLESSRPGAPLEWDESAMDSQSSVEGFLDHNRSVPALGWVKIVVVLSCAVLVTKLFNLQVIPGNNFGVLAEGNRLRNQTILAPRGLIFDRFGQPLVQNVGSFSLVAVPVVLPKQDVDSELAKLVPLLHLDNDSVRAQIGKIDRASLEPVVIQQDISPDDRILFETRAEEFPGFSIRTVPIRQYPEAEIFSHVLGYAGIISEQELSQHQSDKYESNDYIGKTGIELSYEKYLRGVNGQEQMEVDALGKPVKTLGTIDPLPGDRVELNIDKGLQEQFASSFKVHSGSPRGAAIALDPRNGQVLALLSMPGYDNNLFAQGISTQDYQKLTSDKNLPLFNRAIAGTYPSGSTIKPTVAVAALQQGTIDEHTVIVDRGKLVIPNQFNPSISYDFFGWKHSGLGPMTVRSAIAMSSDIFFYTVAGGYPATPNVQGLGADKLAEYYRKFGMGAVTGIDLQGEQTGRVADPAWKADYYKGDAIQSKWYLGDTYHIGIGQGDMLVTPLQVAEWTATIADGGTGYKPVILRRVADQAGKTVYQPAPQILIKKFADDKNVRIVQEGMEQAVSAGTARSLNSLPVCSAGKTGTSQFDGADPTRTHAWFTMYAPCDHPQIVITVLAEAGGEGNAVALPIAKDVFSWWIKNRFQTNQTEP